MILNRKGLERALKRSCITKAEFCRKYGHNIYAILRSNVISMTSVRRISAFVGCKPSELIESDYINYLQRKRAE